MSDIDIMQQLSNTDLSTVQTALPTLADGLYEATVAEIKTKPNSKGTGHNLEIKVTLNSSAPALVNDQPTTVNPGFPVFDTISLVQTTDEAGAVKYDPLPKLAAFREACTGSKAGSFMPLEQYIGARIAIRTKIETDKTGQYAPRARIMKYQKMV